MLVVQEEVFYSHAPIFVLCSRDVLVGNLCSNGVAWRCECQGGKRKGRDDQKCLRLTFDSVCDERERGANHDEFDDSIRVCSDEVMIPNNHQHCDGEENAEGRRVQKRCLAAVQA